MAYELLLLPRAFCRHEFPAGQRDQAKGQRVPPGLRERATGSLRDGYAAVPRRLRKRVSNGFWQL